MTDDTERVVFVELLVEAHRWLDAHNAVIDKASCWVCGARGYDGDGLKHTEECIIRRIRKHVGEGLHG